MVSFQKANKQKSSLSITNQKGKREKKIKIKNIINLSSSMSNEMQTTNLLPFSNAQNVHPDMARIKDETHENGSSRANQGTPPESPCMKGNNATASTSSGNSNGNPNANLNKEQDRFLPIANVGRIMKKVIPTNGKISKDAKETVQECVSEFISFITGEASEKCQGEKRKTINGDDIIWAITSLGFEDYVNPLKLYLNKYREIEGEKLNVPKQQQHQHQNQLRSVASDHHQQQQQLQHPRMHPYPHFQRPDQMAMLGANVGGLAPFPNPVGVFTSQRTLAHQTQYVGTDQGFSSPFSPSNSNSLQKPYHQNIEQIDSVGHW